MNTNPTVAEEIKYTDGSKVKEKTDEIPRVQTQQKRRHQQRNHIATFSLPNNVEKIGTFLETQQH